MTPGMTGVPRPVATLLVGLALAGAVLLGPVLLGGGPADAQNDDTPTGPTPLFPTSPPTETAPQPAPPPESETPSAASPLIQATPLAAANLGTIGDPDAEQALGGPLWANGASPDLALRLAALPARIDESTLFRLQRSLLVAPGPDTGGADLLAARIGRLIAMGAPEDAAGLADLIPDGQRTAVTDDAALGAWLAADRLDRACPFAEGSTRQERLWVEARIDCAAIQGDPGRADLLLEVARAGAVPATPVLGELVDALGGTRRLRLTSALPDDPALLPLLRRAPLEPKAAVVARASPLVRRAIAGNDQVPAGLRPPVEDLARRAAPASAPGLDGEAPADWNQALAALPEKARATWLAAVDALGVPVPDAVWARLPAAGRRQGPMPDLAVFRELTDARAAARRGSSLLAALVLLDGRPAAASPLALATAVETLRWLGLKDDARSLAAGALRRSSS